MGEVADDLEYETASVMAGYHQDEALESGSARLLVVTDHHWAYGVDCTVMKQVFLRVSKCEPLSLRHLKFLQNGSQTPRTAANYFSKDTVNASGVHAIVTSHHYIPHDTDRSVCVGKVVNISRMMMNGEDDS